MQTASCSVCGTTVEGDPPLTWSTATATGPRGRTLVCDRCTRDNVRSIEARLDEQWW
jgi:transposase